MDHEVYTLNNGIRLVHKRVSSDVAHCGIFINTGSRDEKPAEHGMAHYIEHVIFKGTKKRRAYHVISRLENVGAEIDAYTTKEETCIYASFLKRYYDRTIELLYDIVFNSIFPEHELKREKEVIIDEINSYRDNPSELIFEDFEEFIFPDHPLGRSILGTPESLKGFTRQDIIDFIGNNYHTDQIVFCSVGNIRFGRLCSLFTKYFDGIRSGKRNSNRKSVEKNGRISKTINRSTYQTHCVIGNTAYELKDKRRTGLFLLNNILGGQVMNSRLNLALREKHGYAYNIESSYTPYIDTGLLTIYFGTEKEHLEKSLDIVYYELKKLRDRKLGILQLSKAKKQMAGQVAIAGESNLAVMLSIGKSFLHLNRADTIAEVLEKTEAVTSEELLDIANELLDREKLSVLIYK